MHDVLQLGKEVSIPVDKVRASPGYCNIHYPREFQSPWIRFARDFLREVASAIDDDRVSIPVDKVRANTKALQHGLWKGSFNPRG